MTKQDFFSRQQSNGTFSGGTIRQQPQKSKDSHVGTWITIILIIALIIAGIVYKDKIFNQTFEPIDEQNAYLIGTDIEIEGSLSSDGDILNYTHTLTTPDAEIYLLKSKTVSLNNYSNLSGNFQVKGTIESLYNGKPLVEVNSIITTSQESDIGSTENIEDTTPQGTYISNAGLGFTASFYDNYAFVGDDNKGNLSIKNLDTDDITTINYFTCTDAGDTNCKQLSKTFESNAEKKITTINGDTFYKLPEVKSWYFQNNNRWGYFINNASDEEVEKIKDYIIIPNNNLIKDIVNRYGLKVCFGNDQGMNTITSHTTNKINNDLLITMKGAGDKIFTCEAVLDLSLSNKLDFVDIKIEEKTVEEENQEIKEEPENKADENKEVEEIKKESAKDTISVETPATQQFAINLDKQMTYDSKRDYILKFPSSNISYTSDISNEDFNQVGVRCTHTIKAIQYKNKDQLQDNPSVIVYECTAKNGIELPGNNYILKELGDKKFVIQINDPARYDFAKNIVIESA